MQNKYVIWSTEHRAWWKAESCGYTTETEDIGLYDLEDATNIVHDSNIAVGKGQTPEEFMFPWEVIKSLLDYIEATDSVCDSMQSILINIADIVKGKPKPLHRHGWADLPELIKELKNESKPN